MGVPVMQIRPHWKNCFWQCARWLILFSGYLHGFVVLDTSIELPKTDIVDSALSLEKPNSTPLYSEPGLSEKKPHYGHVLFLSADNKLVYAYIGVIKALEEYGLNIDLVLTESKATLVGAAWALGYSSRTIEKQFLDNPIETYVKPFEGDAKSEEESFTLEKPFHSALEPAGTSPWIFPFPLPLPLHLKDPLSKDFFEASRLKSKPQEFLHLSWMLAKLTHDAPAGPVEELAATPKALAIQIADLDRRESFVVTEGRLQNLLKGALLPIDILRKRPAYWPFASGALLSSHRVLAEKLPFTFDQMIVIHAGANLKPPSLDAVPASWLDSLSEQPTLLGQTKIAKDAFPERIMAIELQPQLGFDPEDKSSEKWIELGYLSTLRTMDVLKSVLGSDASAEVVPLSRPASPIFPRSKLSLNRVSLNPLASGGRQLLLDLVRTNDDVEMDPSGDGSVAAILRSGFYSDLDLEWTRAIGEERAILIFDSKEKSQLKLKAGINAQFLQVHITDRSPEMYAALVWEEPFYLPFKTEGGFLFGGHRPGYEFRSMISPIYPLRLDLGVSRTHLEIFYPHASGSVPDLNAYALRLNRDLQEVFLKIYPTSFSYFRTSVQKHSMSIPDSWSGGEGEFLSTDFQETAYLGLGKVLPSGAHPRYLWLRYRNLNRVNLAGEIKSAVSNLEVRVGMRFGDFLFSDQYHGSNQKINGFNLYDIVESGRIDAFSFQDEYFFSTLRAPNFHNLKLTYAPVIHKIGMRFTGGLFRKYGDRPFALSPVFESNSEAMRYYWEAQVGLETPLGTLKTGMAGLQGERPFYFLKIGKDLSLGFGEMN